MFVYTLICSTFNVEIMSKMRKLFELLINYKNCFDFKNAKTLSEYKNKDYVIDFILDANSSYEFFYTLFKIAFDILKNYSLKNLILNCLREFTSCANASIFLVFKKNDIFRLYVDYKELNTFIIKKRYLFFSSIRR